MAKRHRRKQKAVNAAPAQKGLNVGNTPGMISSGCNSFVSYLQHSGHYDLSHLQAINYYLNCAPLSDAVDKIKDKLLSIPPKVWSKSRDEYVDHPVLEFLQRPNAEQSYEDFITEYAINVLVTGNAYPYTTNASFDRPPLELRNYAPYSITLLADNADGFIGSINVHNYYVTTTYNRDEPVGLNRFSYIDSEDSEIMPVRMYNPRPSAGNLYGVSKIASIMPEIEQYLMSSQHNQSLLSNGARLSGVLSSNNELPMNDTQFQRLQAQWDKYFVGPQNAGRPLLTENLTWTDTSMNNRDMDYATMKRSVTEMIYSRYDVPLSLVSTESMTLDNLKVANVMIYDNTAFPLYHFLFGKLGSLLFYRWRNEREWANFRDFEFHYDEKDIPALQERRVSATERLANMYVLSDNEIRTELGKESIGPAGDLIYKPQNLVPVASDVYTDDNINPVIDEDEVDDTDQKRLSLLKSHALDARQTVESKH